MKALSAKIVRSLPVGTKIETCDNSGAQILRIFSVKGQKTVKGRYPAAGVADLVNASIIKGRPGMKKQVVQAVIVRQRKEYQRLTGERVKFEDNAAVVVKDEKGIPQGTILKGPIAREVTTRWPNIAKLAKIIV